MSDTAKVPSIASERYDACLLRPGAWPEVSSTRPSANGQSGRSKRGLSKCASPPAHDLGDAPSNLRLRPSLSSVLLPPCFSDGQSNRRRPKSAATAFQIDHRIAASGLPPNRDLVSYPLLSSLSPSATLSLFCIRSHFLSLLCQSAACFDSIRTNQASSRQLCCCAFSRRYFLHPPVPSVSDRWCSNRTTYTLSNRPPARAL